VHKVVSRLEGERKVCSSWSRPPLGNGKGHRKLGVKLHTHKAERKPEQIYFDAWSFAAQQTPAAAAEAVSPAKPALDEFIPNWSSPAFASYVDQCAKAVDDLPQVVYDPQAIDALWKNLLELESRFWPEP
jgi:hypothetical protein